MLGLLLRRPWRLPGIVLFAALLVPFALGQLDRGQLKSLLLRCTLRGLPRAAIESWTGRFVPRLLARGVHADALRQIAAHRRAGARLVLLSASTELYVPAIAQALGFDETICTGVRWNGEYLDGHLTTANRRGAEKVRCLESLRSRHPRLRTAAYGNARSDLAHLQLCEEPWLVNGSAGARREAAALGIACIRWH